VGLIVFGVIELVVALLMGLSTIVLAFMVFAGSSSAPFENVQPDMRTLGPALLLYGGAAVAMACTGMGSILSRRWVRPIALLIAWPWLLAGCTVVGIVIAAIAGSGAGVLLPAASGTTVAGGLEQAFLAAGVVLIVLLYVVLPGVLVWFYQQERLRIALTHLDPRERWTDRCPAPVLGLSLGLGFGAIACLAALLQPSLSLFGSTLTGTAAAAVIIASAAGMAALAFATYRMSPAGWWGTLALTIALTVISIDVALRFDPGDLWRSFGIPVETPEAGAELHLTHPTLLVAATVLFGLACVGYLMYVRRFFIRRIQR
jgi:hypothetical protein